MPWALGQGDGLYSTLWGRNRMILLKYESISSRSEEVEGSLQPIKAKSYHDSVRTAIVSVIQRSAQKG
jgi:hypothetical protein